MEFPLWWEVISQFTDHNVKFVAGMGGGTEAKHGAARINKGPLHTDPDATLSVVADHHFIQP